MTISPKPATMMFAICLHAPPAVVLFQVNQSKPVTDLNCVAVVAFVLYAPRNERSTNSGPAPKFSSEI